MTAVGPGPRRAAAGGARRRPAPTSPAPRSPSTPSRGAPGRRRRRRAGRWWTPRRRCPAGGRRASSAGASRFCSARSRTSSRVISRKSRSSVVSHGPCRRARTRRASSVADDGLVQRRLGDLSAVGGAGHAGQTMSSTMRVVVSVASRNIRGGGTWARGAPPSAKISRDEGVEGRLESGPGFGEALQQQLFGQRGHQQAHVHLGTCRRTWRGRSPWSCARKPLAEPLARARRWAAGAGAPPQQAQPQGQRDQPSQGTSQNRFTRGNPAAVSRSGRDASSLTSARLSRTRWSMRPKTLVPSGSVHLDLDAVTVLQEGRRGRARARWSRSSAARRGSETPRARSALDTVPQPRMVPAVKRARLREVLRSGRRTRSASRGRRRCRPPARR